MLHCIPWDTVPLPRLHHGLHSKNHSAPSQRNATSRPNLGAQLIWRTREADHYGLHGWTGALERRQCKSLSASQRAALSLSNALGASRLDAVHAASIWLLDGARSTAGAHTAHPPHCLDASPNESWVDCRHFCQPGPVEDWNHQLVAAMEAKHGLEAANFSSGETAPLDPDPSLLSL